MPANRGKQFRLTLPAGLFDTFHLSPRGAELEFVPVILLTAHGTIHDDVEATARGFANPLDARGVANG